MESALGASRGATVSCPQFRNKEMGSSSNSKCKMGCLNFSFNNPSHKQYYAGAVRVYCGKRNKLEKQNLKKLGDLHGGSLSDKRRMKLLKSVSKNLLLLSVSFSQDADKSLIEEVRDRNFSDAVEVLMTKMDQEKAEHKQRKKAMKAEKKKVQNKCEDESTSCDWTSSVTEIPEPPLITGDAITAISMEENSERGARVRGVEVCMGGKCKKSGAEKLLAAIEERISGVEAVGCKCMGKCRNAPNVRVKSDVCQELHMGVGIADVGIILDYHFGAKQEELLQSKDVVWV